MSPSRTLLTCGYVALDVVHGADGTWLRAGGTAANVAAISAYLGWNASVVARLGDDDAGPLVKRDLEINGVNTAAVSLASDVGTPLVLHEVMSDRAIFRFGCSACGRSYRAHRPPRAEEVGRYTDANTLADVFFFDRASKAGLVLAAHHREKGRRVVYEPGSPGRLESHLAAIELADIVKFSDERRPLFAGALDRPHEGQLWIETRGQHGARISTRAWQFDVPAHVVEVVDPVGAGDWFTAALLTGLQPGPWHKGGVREAARRASALAALACLVPGARGLSEIVASSELEGVVAKLLEAQPPQIRASPRGALDQVGYCPRCRLPLPARGLAIAG